MGDCFTAVFCPHWGGVCSSGLMTWMTLFLCGGFYPLSTGVWVALVGWGVQMKGHSHYVFWGCLKTSTVVVRCSAYIFPVVKNVPINTSAHVQ